MKKITIIFLLFILSIFLISCNSSTDLDSHRDKTQFLFRDVSKNVVSNNDNLYYSGEIDIDQLLFSSEKGFYFASIYTNDCQTIYFYDYQTEKCEEIKNLSYRIYTTTYEFNLIVMKDEKYYLLDFDTFEIINEIDYMNTSINYECGLDNFSSDNETKKFDYNGKVNVITIDNIINNCDIKEELKLKKDKLSLGGLYRYGDELYISVKYKYSWFSRKLLVFYINENEFSFIDYYHYSVDNVEYIKFQS